MRDKIRQDHRRNPPLPVNPPLPLFSSPDIPFNARRLSPSLSPITRVVVVLLDVVPFEEVGKEGRMGVEELFLVV